MTRVRLLDVLVLLATTAMQIAAQPRGASITGLVRDSTGAPVRSAEVIAQPGDHHARSDSTGHFAFNGLSADKYRVRARRIGFSPAEWTVDLSKDAHVDIRLTLTREVTTLDTVIIVAGRECSVRSLDGFVCRRQGGKGLFLDYTDIDDKDPIYTADIFRGIEGFRVEVRSTPRGPLRYPISLTGWRCLNSLVDGRPVSLANAIPENPYDLIAVEIYRSPDEVPKEYQRFVWGLTGDRASRNAPAGRCSLIVYWTLWAPTSR